MFNNHSHYSLLEHYLNQSETLAWVLVTIVNKEGSSYRSPGAFMLVNSLGQSYGLVSGGCLEANIILHAKKVFDSQQAHYVEYDMREEDGYAAELGVGCKGKIGVLLQYLTTRHQGLLTELLQRMQAGQSSYIQQVFLADELTTHSLNDLSLFDTTGELLVSTISQHTRVKSSALMSMIKQNCAHQNITIEQSTQSITRISAPINLWVFGGGSDAIPLVVMAAQMGWRVTVVDHRASYARSSSFKYATNIIRIRPEELAEMAQFRQLDAAVLMTHNLNLDAAWLKLLHINNIAKYIGLLGPLERRANVETLAGITDRSWLTQHVNGPVGLDIGGDLPESIALSILAQCHSVLYNRNALALSGKFINN